MISTNDSTFDLKKSVQIKEPEPETKEALPEPEPSRPLLQLAELDSPTVPAILEIPDYTHENQEARRVIIFKIRNWLSHKRFEEYLKQSGFPAVQQLPTFSLAELQRMLDDIKFAIRHRGGDQTMEKVIVPGALRAVEVGSLMCGYDMTGLGATLEDNPDWQDQVAELACEHQYLSRAPAEQRLLLTLAGAMHLQYQRNQQKAVVSITDKPVPADVLAQYADVM